MEDEIQEQIYKKQMYLRENILEAGYDVQVFTDYLDSIKPGSI